MTNTPVGRKFWAGGLAYLYPFQLMSLDEVPFGSFSQGRNRFFNLKDCEHLKVSGVAVRLPGVTNVSDPDGICGTIYSTTGIGSYNRIVSSSDQLYTNLQGTYNGIATGNWYFGVGIYILGDIVIQAIGTPDMANSSKYHGEYYFRITQAQAVSSSQFRVRENYYFQFSQRLSKVSPLKAIENVLAYMLALNSGASWETRNLSTCLANNSDLADIPSSVPFTSSIFTLADRNPNWNILASQAYNSVPFFQSNGIALGLDIASLRSDLKTTFGLLSKLVSKSIAPSVIAKLFLAFYYGWRLLVLDLKSVSKAASDISALRSRYQKCSSHSTWEIGGSTYRAYFHCYYRRYANLSSQLDQFVSMFDLELNLGNIWDLIPFSFVLDWFIDLGDKLESLDNYYQMTQEHQIICSGRSIKCQRTMSTTQAGLRGWLGVIDISYYERSYTDAVFEPQFSLSSPQPFNHIVEGTALVVSRR